MVTIAVVSDTHVPSRASSIPQWVRARIEAADHTIHAGDFDSAAAYERVYTLADGDLTAVAGNTDPIGLDVPNVATVSLSGVTFVVNHGHGGGRGNYEDHVARIVREEGGDVGVSGHTHEPMDRRFGEIRLLNPGSATGAAPATEASAMVVSVEDGSLDVDLIRQ